MTALTTGGRFPVTFTNTEPTGATSDTNRRVILLRAVDAVREVVVSRDPIELRRRLVLISRPCGTAVVRHLSAAIVSDQHAFGILRINPQVVVVAVRRSNGREVRTAIVGTPEADVQHIHFVNVVRPGVDPGVVPGSLTQVAIFVHASPGFSRIVTAEQTAVSRLNDCPNAVRIDRRDSNATNSDSALRQTAVLCNFLPRRPAVGTLPQPGTFSTTFQAVRSSKHLPCRCVKHACVVWIEHNIHRARFVVGEQDTIPRLATVGRSEDPALLARSIQVTQCRYENDVGICGVDTDPRNVFRIFKADVFPVLATVDGLPHAVAAGHVTANSDFTAADVNRVRVGFRNRNRTN